MSAWRVIVTDTESFTGVAPVCESQDHAHYLEVSRLKGDGTGPDVFDCCPWPQLELWSESTAATVAEMLTVAEAKAAGT